MQAQQRLQSADTPTANALKKHSRDIIDELFDDEGDREIIEEKVNQLVDLLTESPYADSAVDILLDAAQRAYHSSPSGS